VLDFIMKCAGLLLTAILCLANTGFAAKIPVDKAIKFTSGGLNIEMASPGNGMGFVSLMPTRKQSEEFIKHPKNNKADLWKLVMTSDVSDDSKFFGLTNLNGTGENSAEISDERIVLSWKNLDIPDEPDCLDVTVTIDRKGDSGFGEWRIKVANRSQRAGIFRVIFPVMNFTKIGKSGEDDYLMLPFAEGYLAKDPLRVDAKGISRSYWDVATDAKPTFRNIRKIAKSAALAARPGGLSYPSMAGQMQFCAYYEKRQKGRGFTWRLMTARHIPRCSFLLPGRWMAL
jgi:hypothetical protein